VTAVDLDRIFDRYFGSRLTPAASFLSAAKKFSPHSFNDRFYVIFRNVWYNLQIFISTIQVESVQKRNIFMYKYLSQTCGSKERKEEVSSISF
jgi:hypothetical protein